MVAKMVLHRLPRLCTLRQDFASRRYISVYLEIEQHRNGVHGDTTRDRIALLEVQKRDQVDCLFRVAWKTRSLPSIPST